MNNLEAKVLFELNKDGKVTIEVTGRRSVAKAEVLTIIEKMAELEQVTVAELLAEFQNIVKMRDENPIDIIKNLLDKMFGGKQ
jgi:UDP-N-acetylmuramate-alanine ligase